MIQLSYSAAQKYLLSPFQYLAHYLLRLRPIETGSALHFGGALDLSFNSLLIDVKDGKPADLQKALDLFYDNWSKVKHEQVKYSKADLDESLLEGTDSEKMGGSRPWQSLCIKGYILIQEYYEQVIPRLEKVLLVQHEIALKNEVGDTFIGVIDLVAQIDGKIWIIDNKSSSIVYKADSVSSSGQLATYFEALKDQYDLAGACYIVIPKKIRKVKRPKVQIEFIFGEISEELILDTFEDYENVLSGIKTGKFECSRKCMNEPWGCSYKDFCSSGGSDMTGLHKVESSKR